MHFHLLPPPCTSHLHHTLLTFCLHIYSTRPPQLNSDAQLSVFSSCMLKISCKYSFIKKSLLFIIYHAFIIHYLSFITQYSFRLSFSHYSFIIHPLLYHSSFLILHYSSSISNSPSLPQGISDGAGAVVLASEKACGELGLAPLARLVGYAVAGVDPTIMGIGPVPAIRKLLKVSGMELKDIQLVEVRIESLCFLFFLLLWSWQS